MSDATKFSEKSFLLVSDFAAAVKDLAEEVSLDFPSYKASLRKRRDESRTRLLEYIASLEAIAGAAKAFVDTTAHTRINGEIVKAQGSMGTIRAFDKLLAALDTGAPTPSERPVVESQKIISGESRK